MVAHASDAVHICCPALRVLPLLQRAFLSCRGEIRRCFAAQLRFGLSFVRDDHPYASQKNLQNVPSRSQHQRKYLQPLLLDEWAKEVEMFVLLSCLVWNSEASLDMRQNP